MTFFKIKQYLKNELMLRDLITYEVKVDDEYSDNGEDLGIDLISNVKTPAVKIKGVALSCDKIKDVRFTDDKKYRIAAPVMVPGDIYRNDTEEYMLRFTPDIIEKMAKKFMANLTKKNGGVFNLEHGNEMIDSYILESYLVDSEAKVDMIKKEFGIDLPLHSFFLVQQFNDKNKYNELVANGQTGFSLEGFLGMELVKMTESNKEDKIKEKSKLTKMKKKLKFVGTKRVLKSASKKRLEEVVETEELIIVAEEITENAEVVVVEDVTAGPIEDFTGEVDVVVDGVEEVLIIENGVITEVVVSETEETPEAPEAEMEEEKVEEEISMEEEKVEEEVVMEEEKVDEDIIMEDVVEEVIEDVEPKDKMAEVYEMIAELKAEIASLKEPKVEEEVVMNRSRFTSALTSFVEFNKNRD